MATLRLRAPPQGATNPFPNRPARTKDDEPIPPALRPESGNHRTGLAHSLRSPAVVLSLQHTIGNTAVQRLLTAPSLETEDRAPALGQASPGVVQRALWANAAAKFRTDNESDEIPDSEYKVNAGGYVRYAPINMTRAMEQVFHEGPRSFAYIDGTTKEVQKDAKYDAIWERPIEITSVAGDDVEFTTRKEGLEDAPPVVGHITPTEGATVFDFGVDDSTGILNPDGHVGHTVEDLGEPLPTLDDPDALNAARDYQNFLLEQYRMLRQMGKVESFADWNKQSGKTNL